MKNIRAIKIAYACAFIVVSALLILKSFYGFGWHDEAYYLAVALRFSKGDIPVIHSWHPTQWSGIILAPLFTLYHSVSGGTEGIVLFFRLFWCFVVIIEAIALWKVLDRYYSCKVAGFLSALSVLVYSTENKALYSYYDLSVHFLLFSMLLLLVAFREKRKGLYFSSGIIFAMAVLANPYLVMLILYFLAALVLFCRRNKSGRNSAIAGAVCFCVGGLIIAVSLLWYVIGQSSLELLVKSLHYMFNMPDHPVRPFVVTSIQWFWYLLKSYTVPGILLHIVCIILFFSKKQGRISDFVKKQIVPIEMFWFVTYLIVQYFLGDDKHVIGVAFIPLLIVGLFCVVSGNIVLMELMCFFTIPGLVLSYSFQLASATGIYGMMTGISVAIVPMFVVFEKYISVISNRRDKNLLFVMLFICLCYTFCQRLVYYRPATYERNWDCVVGSGVYKGIVTDIRQRDYYYGVLSELEKLKNETEAYDNVLVVGSADSCWVYIELDRNIGSFFEYENYMTNPLLEEYYTIHPEKIPKAVYYEKNNL